MLISAIHQHGSSICIIMTPPCWASLPSPTTSPVSRFSHSPGLSFPNNNTNSHSILHILVYMFPAFIHWYYPLLPTHSTSPKIRSIYLHLHCCLTNRFISAIFYIPYLCFNDIYTTHTRPWTSEARGTRIHCSLMSRDHKSSKYNKMRWNMLQMKEQDVTENNKHMKR